MIDERSRAFSRWQLPFQSAGSNRRPDEHVNAHRGARRRHWARLPLASKGAENSRGLAGSLQSLPRAVPARPTLEGA